MTTISSIAAPRSRSGVRVGIIRSIAIWIDRLAGQWRFWITINELHQLDDRRLRDIGLTRDQIETVALQLRRLR